MGQLCSVHLATFFPPSCLDLPTSDPDPHTSVALCALHNQIWHFISLATMAGPSCLLPLFQLSATPTLLFGARYVLSVWRGTRAKLNADKYQIEGSLFAALAENSLYFGKVSIKIYEVFRYTRESWVILQNMWFHSG